MELLIDPLERYDHIDVLFGPDNPNWQQIDTFNKAYLSLMQNVVTDKLRANGFLFVNEVLQLMGLPRTKEGQVLGWVWGKTYGVPFEFEQNDDGESWNIQIFPSGPIWPSVFEGRS